MMRQSRLNPEFVEFIPEQLKEGVLYVSMTYAVASHKCVCGCGHEVVTPLSPTDWQLFFDGRGVSLNSSIGNWSIPCRSHYWIKDNNVDWAGEMPYWAINQGRARNKAVKEQYYASQETPASESAKVQQDFSNPSDKSSPEMKQKSWWGGACRSSLRETITVKARSRLKAHFLVPIRASPGDGGRYQSVCLSQKS